MTGLTFLVQISVGEKEGIATVWGQIGLTHWKLCQTKLISEFTCLAPMLSSPTLHVDVSFRWFGLISHQISLAMIFWT